MNAIIYFLVQPYVGANSWHIALELIAVVFGILSVVYARKESILVYPTGIISTIIYVFLLLQWQLYGDFIINIYYTLMSLYGWYMWSRVLKTASDTPKESSTISRTSPKDKLMACVIFVLSFILVVVVYRYHNVMPNTMGFKDSMLYFWQHLSTGQLSDIKMITPYIDSVTTGVFFAAMWLMANKKIENWTLWIIGDMVSIPLYLVKGYGFTALQYVVFTVLAIMAYFNWRRLLSEKIAQYNA